MAKPKKLTLKIFENKQLKEVESESGSYSPLYLMLTYNGKVKTIKSPTFELIDHINFNTYLIYEDALEIERNDRRLFEGIRKFLENTGKEFSLGFVSQQNEEYSVLKTPIFRLIGEKVRSNLFTFFEGEKKLSASALVLGTFYNWEYSMLHLKEISPSVYSEFKEYFPAIEEILSEFSKLSAQNYFPYMIDFQLNRPEIMQLKRLFNSI